MGSITDPTAVMWDVVGAHEEEFSTAVFSGINGDAAHQDSPGKHLSWSQNRDKFGSNCWPLQAPNDKNAKVKDKAIAVDISMDRNDQNRCHNNLKKVYDNRSNDPRAKYLYAFNGWDGNGSPGRYNLYKGTVGTTNDSHKWHEHEEFYYLFVNDPELVRAIQSAIRGETIAEYEGNDMGTLEGDQARQLSEAERTAQNGDEYWYALAQLRTTVGGLRGNNNQTVEVQNQFLVKFLEMHAVIMGGASEETLAAIKQAAREGAEAGAADVQAIVDGVLAGINTLGLTDAQKVGVAEVMHEVLPQYVGPPVQQG